MSDVARGQELLDRLRGVGIERPRHDLEVELEVLARLEAAAKAAADLPEAVTVRVTKNRLRQVLLCETHLVARLGEPMPISPELIRGRLLDRLFAQVIVGCEISPDPVADSLSGANAAGDAALLTAWEALNVDEQAEVREVVTECALALRDRWPALPGAALVRFEEPLRVELCDGRVVLSGRVDLVLGRPAHDRAGSTLLDVKSGKRRHDDALDAGWYAVLETIRHRAAPFQVGSYYLLDGSLDLAVLDSGRLVQTSRRVADGIERLVGLALESEPTTSPNGLCPWCPALASCEAGRRYVAEQGMSVTDDVYVIDDDEEENAF